MAYLSLNQTVPLRSTLDWGEYGAVQTIPQVYGVCTLTPLQYDQRGLRWVLADHPIIAVERVTRDDIPAPFEARQIVDPSDQPIAVLELDRPLIDGERLAVTLRGKPDPKTGQLLQNPALILWDFLANVCGQPLLRAEVDNFRLECERAELAVNWVVQDATKTIRATVAELMRQIGARWSPYAVGLARLWPPPA